MRKRPSSSQTLPPKATRKSLRRQLTIETLEDRRLLVAGALDSTFGTAGKVITPITAANDDIGRAIIAQPDGKLVVAGYSQIGTGNTEFSALRYNANGTLDTTFASAGKFSSAFSGLHEQGKAIAIQNDNKLVIAGDVSNGSSFDFGLIRLNANGTLDTSFGVNGLRTTGIGPGVDSANAVAIDATGRILVAGSAFNAGSLDFAVARYTSSGALDTTYGSSGKAVISIGSGDDVIHGIALQADGKLVVVGSSIQGGTPDFAVARLDANGALDTSFDGDGKLTLAYGTSSDIAYAVTIQPDGRILVGGSAKVNSNTDFDFAVARLTSNGALDTFFDGDGKATAAVGTSDDEAYAITLQPNGQVVLAGVATVGSSSDSALVRFNGDGTLDTLFDGDGIATYALSTGSDSARGVALLNDGTIAVAGPAHNGSNLDFGTAFVVGNAAIDTSYGTSGKTVTNLSGYDWLGAVAVQTNGQIVAVGSQTHATRAEDWTVVRYNVDGTLDTTFNSNFQSSSTAVFFSGFDQASSVVIQPADQKILVAGTTTVAGGQSQFTIARFLPTGELDTTFNSGAGFRRTAFGTSQALGNAMALDSQGRIVVGGQAGTGSLFDFAVARYAANGTLDSTFGSAGTTVFPFSAGDDRALALAIGTGDSIVLAGYNDPGSNLDGAVIRLLATGLIDTSFGTAGRVTIDYNNNNDVFNSVAISSGNGVVLGGLGVTSGNVADRDFALAKLTSAGLLDTTFDLDGKQTTRITGANDGVAEVVVLPNGEIIAIGEAVTTAGKRISVARYLANGSLDADFGNSGVMLLGMGRLHDAGTSAALVSNNNLLVAGVSFNGNDDDLATTRISLNSTPNDVVLSSTSIAENLPVGTVVGSLSTIDQDTGDTFTYALVSGPGSADNASFQMVGNSLRTAASFNYNTQSSYSIRVRSTDAQGGSLDKIVSIQVVTNFQLPVLDINSTLSTSGSSPSSLIVVGSTVYFVAATPTTGNELWKTDGTAAGTVLVKDIRAGTGGSGPAQLTNVNGTIYFRANDGTNGYELWKSDGTAAGTVLVKDVFSGTNNAGLVYLTNSNGTLLFRASDGVNGYELWKSDGTAAGTVMVKDIASGAGHSGPGSLTVVNGTVYFNASDGINGYELWKSDGTAAGTVLVKDIFVGNNSLPQNLTNVNGLLFFTANDGGNGVELWKSDGTPAGTTMVKDIAGIGGSNPSNLTVVNGTIFFSANDSINGVELWKSDGTPTGTVLVKDISLANSASPTNLANVNGTIYFSASDGVKGRELWKSDGTDAGTVLVKDIGAGTGSGDPRYLTNINGTAYFRASDNINGVELWKSDGTAAGTVLVKDIFAGPNHSYPRSLINFNGAVYFSANDGTNGAEFWKSDGTSASTILVKDISAGTNSASPQNLAIVNGVAYFGATDGINGVELWKSDGTPAGTVLVKDIRVGIASGGIQNLTNVNGTIYFTANDGVNGVELWKSDGTAAGTVLLKDIRTGANNANPRYLTNVNGTVYFRAFDSTNGYELWKSDGTESGTVLVKDIQIGTASSVPTNLVNVNGTLYFSANDGSNGLELWQSDGTAAGTVLVKDIIAASGNAYPRYLTNISGTLYFTANDGINGVELWKSDGTPAGTVMVKDSFVGSDSSNPFELTNVNGAVYFRANDGINGFELWKSDGTAVGTVIVSDILPGTGSSSPTNITNVNGTVFFRANDGTNGIELWKSDGTSVGTSLTKNIGPGSIAGSVLFLTNLNGLLVFRANDGTHGEELWKSDGTSAGTILAMDINPIGGSAPSNLTPFGSILLFTATTEAFGIELHRTSGAPTDVQLSSSAIAENQPAGTNVGTFTSTDADSIDVFTYALVSGTGATDNANFQITGNVLTTTTTFNYNTQSVYSIRVRSTDTSGLSFEKIFSISVTPNFGTAQLLQSIAPPSTASSNTGAQFGRSVAASASYFVVGASGVDVGSTIDAGQAFVYNPNAAAITLTQTLNNPSLSNTDQMGYTAAITNDVVVLGAPFDRVGTVMAGRAMLFNAATGTLIATLDNPAAVDLGRFGIAVAAANGLVAVGSPGNSVGASGSGSIYVYNSAGVLQRTINNPSPTVGGAFGTSVDMNATTLVIGSGSASGGKAYVYNVLTGALLRTIDNPTSNSSDRFGDAVALSGNMLAVGTYGGIPTGNTVRSGRVFLYDISNGALLRTIDPPTQAANDQFGISLDFEANYLVIGAPKTDINGLTDVGAAYVYDAATGALISGLSNPLPSTNDQFGYSVAISGARILVGSYLEDTKASDQGYVHLFSMAAPPFAINLSSTTVAENVPTGTTVATLSITPTNNPPITYALVPGTGGADNGSFRIVGNQLQTNSLIDFETKSAYSVLVEATDAAGKKVQRIVGISVNNVNETPTALLISNNHLAENQAVGTIVATLSTLDPDIAETFIYSLPVGQADNDQFTIVGNQLKTNKRFDYETRDNYTVSIRSQDSGGLSITWAYLISVDDLNPPAPPANPRYDLRNVVDLNNAIQSSTPSSPVELAGVAYFAGTSPTFGRELYRSDRTLAGTSVVKDLVLGGDANPESLTVFNGHVYFLSSYTQIDGLGNPGSTGYGLWRSDGTAPGTTLVKDFTTLGYTGGMNFKPMQVVNGRLVFTLAFGFNEDLWSTDGTAAGTVLLTSFIAPFGASPFSTLLNTGSQLFINLYVDQTTGSHTLWRTDGTVAGTRQLRSIQQVTPGFEAFDGTLVALGGLVYFSSTDGNGTELWRTDGSVTGTSMVKDINLGGAPPPSSNSGNPAGLAVVNGMLMFSADDGVNGRELWKSDGTAAGTVMVKDIRPGSTFGNGSMSSNNASQRTAVRDGKYYFVANDGVNGTELWSSDGTSAGTTMLTNVGSSEFEGIIPSQLYALTNRLLFTTDASGFVGSQLWSTDGTVAGTAFIADPDGSSPVNNFAGSAFAVGNQLYFNANNPTLGNELWVSDGTTVGTLALRDLATGSASGLTSILASGASGVYFQGNDGVIGTEFGYSNGTVTGTYLLDVARGTPPSDVREVVSNGSILYVATGQGLYKVDDTNHTSVLLTNRVATQLTVVGSSVSFVADSASQSNVLWRSNGTASGTVPVTTSTGAFILDPQMLTNVNGALYYTSTTAANGRELWSGNSQQFEFAAGAASGNVQRIMPVGSKLYVVANEKLYVKDNATYTYLLDAAASTLMPWENVLYFGGFSAANGYELWRTEGTLASTYLVADIVPGPNSSYPGGGVIAGNSSMIAAGEAIEAKLVFRAQDATGAFQLFATNGTTAGTIALTNEPLVTLAGGSTASLAPVNLRSVEGRVYFEGYRQDVGRELWSSNGTPAGTKLVKDLRPGTTPAMVGDPLFVSALFNLQELTSYHGRLFFSTKDSANGTELWTSDGTITGSGIAVDSLPGPSSGNAQNLVVMNDRLYVSANTFDFGIGTQDFTAGELFRLNEAPYAVPVQQSTSQNLATQIRLRGIDRDADPLSYEVVAAPAHGQVTLAGRVATYTPNTGFAGYDAFTYRVFDGSLYSDVVQVEIGVLASNARQVSLVTTDATVNEKSGVYRTAIQLSTVASENLLIPYSIGYGRTGERIDSDVLILAGQTTAEIIVPLRDDNIYTTTPQVIEVTLKNNNVVALGATSEQLITLVDNDLKPVVQFVDAQRSITESDATYSFEVLLNSASDELISVTVNIAGFGATQGTDFVSALTTDLTFEPGQLRKRVMVKLNEDTLGENRETILAQIGLVTNVTVTSDPDRFRSLIYLVDNDASVINISPAVTWLSEGDQVTLQATRTGGNINVPLTVPIDVTSGTAIASDYQLSAPAFQFLAGATTATLTLTAAEDSTAESTEDVLVSVPTSASYLLGTDTQSYIGIGDNDRPIISLSLGNTNVAGVVSPTSIAEKYPSGAGNWIIDVVATLSSASSQTISVPVTVNSGLLNGFATLGQDFLFNTDNFVFAPGVTQVVRQLTILDDSLIEKNELVQIALAPTSTQFSLRKNGIKNDEGLVTKLEIRNNDYGVRTEAPVNVKENAGSFTFTLDIGAPAAGGAFLDILFGGTLSSHEYQIPGMTSSGVNTVLFQIGEQRKTFTVNLTNDALFEGTETFSITAFNAVDLLTTVVNVQDDDAPPSISFGASVSGFGLVSADDPRSLQIPIELSGSVASDTVITIGFGGSAKYGVDFFTPGSLSIGQVVLPANTTSINLPIYPIDNGLVDGDKSLEVTIVSAGQLQLPTALPKIKRTIVDTSRSSAAALREASEELARRVLNKINEQPGALASSLTQSNIGTVEHDRNATVFTGNTPLDGAQPGQILVGDGRQGSILGAHVFFDGNLNGVRDYLDVNANGRQDANEPSEPDVATDLDGSFAMTIPAGFDQNSDGKITASEGRHVLYGGTDVSTGLAWRTQMATPIGLYTITPASTVIERLMSRRGFTYAAAEARVGQALELGTYDFSGSDSFYRILSGDSVAAVLYTRQVMLSSFSLLAASLFSTKSGEALQLHASRALDAMVDSLAASGSRLDLANPTFVGQLLQSLNSYLTAPLSSQQISDAATLITIGADRLQKLRLSDFADPNDFLEAATRIKKTLHGPMTDDLAVVGAGTETLANLLVKYAGQASPNFDSIAAGQSIGQVVTPVLGVTDSAVIEGDNGTKSMEFTVQLLGRHTQNISVNYQTIDGSAVNATGDYAHSSGTLNWAAGDNTSRTLQVTINGDTSFEPDEYVKLLLSDATNAVIRVQEGLGFIINNDALSTSPLTGSNSYVVSHDRADTQIRNQVNVLTTGIFTNPLVATLQGSPTETNAFRFDFSTNSYRSDTYNVAGGTNVDSLAFRAGRFASIVHQISTSSTGKLVLNSFDDQSINVPWTSINDVRAEVTSVDEFVLHLPESIASVVIEDADSGTTGMLRVRSASGEFTPIVFTNPKIKLRIVRASTNTVVQTLSTDPGFTGTIEIVQTGVTLSNSQINENLPANSPVGLFQSQDPLFGNAFALSFVAGAGDQDNASFILDSGTLRANATFNFESKSVYSIRVRAVSQAAGGGTVDRAFTISIADLAEIQQPVQIGDGTSQRSQVKQLVIDFDNDMIVDADAFLVQQRTIVNGVPVFNTVTTQFALSILPSGDTRATLSFSGPLTRSGGALADGYYQLTILGAKVRIRSSGRAFDGDANGVAGGDYVLGAQEADKFFALYGDTNGDGLVGVAEFGQFRSAFGKTSTNAGYNQLFDFENDGSVGVSDFGQFRSRFGKPKLQF